eukprot:1169249-Pleurochrysis_carterae.AAC.1
MQSQKLIFASDLRRPKVSSKTEDGYLSGFGRQSRGAHLSGKSDAEATRAIAANRASCEDQSGQQSHQGRAGFTDVSQSGSISPGPCAQGKCCGQVCNGTGTFQSSVRAGEKARSQ